jgi:hypothetical protein
MSVYYPSASVQAPPGLAAPPQQAQAQQSNWARNTTNDMTCRVCRSHHLTLSYYNQYVATYNTEPDCWTCNPAANNAKLAAPTPAAANASTPPGPQSTWAFDPMNAHYYCRACLNYTITMQYMQAYQAKYGAATEPPCPVCVYQQLHTSRQSLQPAPPTLGQLPAPPTLGQLTQAFTSSGSLNGISASTYPWLGDPHPDGALTEKDAYYERCRLCDIELCDLDAYYGHDPLEAECCVKCRGRG